MSQDETRSLVSRFIEALNAADAKAAAALAIEDIAHDFPGSAREIGAKSLRDRIARLTAGSGFRSADSEIMTNSTGSRAAVEFTWRDDAGASDLAGMFLEIDGGRISRVTVYRL
jgi:hypothetical protein